MKAIFAGVPAHPILANADTGADRLPPVSLIGLFEDYVAAKQRLGKGAEARKRWAAVFRNLRKHLGHDDARRLTRQDLMRWRDAALTTRSAKTVSDVWLAGVRTVLNWAVREDRLLESVAQNVRQKVPKREASRERGFRGSEAKTVLSAAWR